MQHLEVSGAVRFIYVVRQLRVKCPCSSRNGAELLRVPTCTQEVAVLDIGDAGCPGNARHIPQFLQENTELSPVMRSRVFFFLIIPNSLQHSYTI
jgi:hypothetical protein